MSWRTNAWVLMMRNVGRAMGLNKWIASRLYQGGYEVSYDAVFSAFVQTGDSVWDVGANVGYYTRLFSNRVGAQGFVFAFEPSPANFSRLLKQCSSLDNVKLFQYGLGRADGKLHFQQGEDELGASSRVSGTGIGDEIVEIRSGDVLLAEGTAGVPNVIKIDVEGFEWEVLEGMAGLLRRSELRAIGIEVHFGILEERDMGRAPQQIEKLLHDSGFSTSWPDSSHILAVRHQ